MSRKDTEKDDRPHYYSQFWLDVAAGRRVIGGPKPSEEEDLEMEGEPHKVGLRTNVAAMSDGHSETIAHPEVEPEYEQEEFVEPEPEHEDMVEEDSEIEDIVMPDATIDEEEIPDVELTPLEDEEEEEFFDEEEEEEEEVDDLGWGGGRGRKKPKPGRQTKLPSKKPKRERRGY